MSDEQDRAEALDEDRFGGEFPPDKLMGAQAYGAAGAEPHATESVVARAAREEPDDLAQVLDREAAGIPDEDSVERSNVQEREAPRPAEEAAMHAAVDPLDDVDALEALDAVEMVTDADLADAAEMGEDLEGDTTP